VAAAVIVAIGAGLLVRTFAQLHAIDRGFNSTNLLNVRLLLPESRQRDPRAMLALYRDLLPQLESLPGVESASPVHVGPGSGTVGLSAPMLFEGQSDREAATNPWSTWEPVLPSYFRTMGMSIVTGRGFVTSDRRDGAPVAMVSEGVAQRYWPGQNPLGKRLKFVDASDWPWVTVVGVVADSRYRELTKPWMTVYFPADQFFFFQAASLVVRTTSSPDALVPAILDRIRAIEPAAAIESVASMDTLLNRELARPRAAVTITGLFALMAMALAAIGIYGVLSYEVRQRRRELAVRAAVGASPADVFRSVLQRSLLVGAVGAAIGVIAATAATRTLRSLLFEVQPLDPLVFATAAVGLVALVLGAAYFPARRAADSSPLAALRTE
jgi:putative ABC transport system permease protein